MWRDRSANGIKEAQNEETHADVWRRSQTEDNQKKQEAILTSWF